MARGEVLAEMVLQGEGSFISGIDEAGDEMEETSGSAGVLAGALGRMGEQISDAIVPTALLGSRLDETGDEASEAGLKAGGASTGFMALTASTSGAAFSMGVFSAISSKTALVLGGLALAAGAVVTALAPIAIGAAAIGAAFGLIVGSGIYAGMSELQTAFEDVRSQIVPLVKEFGQQFVPFLKETIGMLPGLAKNILDAIGPMDQFLGALRDLRNAAFELLPQLIKWFFDLGRWALPLMRDLAGWIIDSVVPALAEFVSIGKDMTSQFGGLRSAVDTFWKGLQPVLRELGPLVGEMIRLEGIILATGLTLSGKLLPYLAPLIGWITEGFRTANNFAMSLAGVQSSTDNLSPRMKNLRNEVLTLWNNLQPLISTLMDIGQRVMPFLQATVGYLKDTFIDLGLVALNVVNGDFGEARDIFMRILRRMRDFAEKWGGKLLSWLKNTLVPAAVGWFESMGEQAKDSVEEAFGDLINWLETDAWSDIKSAARSLGDILANAFQDAFNAAMPGSVPIPEVTLGEGVPGPDYTFGGGSLPVPSLAVGGRIKESGIFFGHSGEHMMTAAEVDKAEDAPGGGGGGIEQMILKLDADAVKDLLRGEAIDVFDSKIQDTERKKRRRGTF